MFGSLGNLAGLMKQARSFQENLRKVQESLVQQRFEGDAGAGMVRARVNGKGELVEVKIEPSATGDVELLEDMIKAAVGAATQKAHEAMKMEMAKLTGGLSIPGLSELMGA